ncbi:MAG: hypothetical protein RLY21_84 [Planctomycetota bacterium]
MHYQGSNDSSGDAPNNGQGREVSRPAARDEVPLGKQREPNGMTALCVGLDCVQEVRLGALLDEAGVRHDSVEPASEALAHLVANPTDFIFIASGVRPQEFAPLAAQARRISAATKVVVAGPTPSADELLAAVRAGAVDWIDPSDDADSVLARIRSVADAINDERRRDERLTRLKGICQKLVVHRDEFTRQVDELHQGLHTAVHGVQERVDEAEIAGEFRGLLSQELDVEDLLRTALQYLLTKTGPTNAAVYLPGSKPSQFGLGAYVHYDCPRTTAQPLLDRLGEEICERLSHRQDIIRFTDTREFVHAIGMAGAVLEDTELVAWSALNEGECMAVFFMFRNRAEPFKDELAALIDVLRPIFGAQMAKLVRIHHRSSFKFPKLQSDADEAEDADEDEDEGESWRDAA